MPLRNTEIIRSEVFESNIKKERRCGVPNRLWQFKFSI